VRWTFRFQFDEVPAGWVVLDFASRRKARGQGVAQRAHVCISTDRFAHALVTEYLVACGPETDQDLRAGRPLAQAPDQVAQVGRRAGDLEITARSRRGRPG